MFSMWADHGLAYQGYRSQALNRCPELNQKTLPGGGQRFLFKKNMGRLRDDEGFEFGGYATAGVSTVFR